MCFWLSLSKCYVSTPVKVYHWIHHFTFERIFLKMISYLYLIWLRSFLNRANLDFCTIDGRNGNDLISSEALLISEIL